MYAHQFQKVKNCSNLIELRCENCAFTKVYLNNLIKNLSTEAPVLKSLIFENNFIEVDMRTPIREWMELQTIVLNFGDVYSVFQFDEIHKFLVKYGKNLKNIDIRNICLNKEYFTENPFKFIKDFFRFQTSLHILLNPKTIRSVNFKNSAFLKEFEDVLSHPYYTKIFNPKTN